MNGEPYVYVEEMGILNFIDEYDFNDMELMELMEEIESNDQKEK